MNVEQMCPGPYFQLPPSPLSRAEHEIRWSNQCAWEVGASVLHPRVNESDPHKQWKNLPNATCLPPLDILGEFLPGRKEYSSQKDERSQQTYNLLYKPLNQFEDIAKDGDTTEEISELFNGPRQFRSVRSSAANAVARTVSSSNSNYHSESRPSNMERTLSLDDVFRSVVEELDDQLLDKLDPFGPALEEEGNLSPGFFPLSAPAWDVPSGPVVGISIPESFPPADRPFQRRHFVPRPYGAQSIDTSFSFFDRLNKEMATALKNHSRGLITVMRRICELLAQPRSDRLEAVFVRLLNKTFDEMEKATRARTRRPSKRKDETQVTWKPQKEGKQRSLSDMQRHFGNRIPVRECFTSTYSSERLPDVGLINVAKRAQNVDLTQRNHLRTESLVALESTVPDFMNGFFS